MRKFEKNFLKWYNESNFLRDYAKEKEEFIWKRKNIQY